MTRPPLARRCPSTSVHPRTAELGTRRRLLRAAAAATLLALAGLLVPAGPALAETRSVLVTFQALNKPLWPVTDPPDGRTMLFDEAWNASGSVNQVYRYRTDIGNLDFGAAASGSPQPGLPGGTPVRADPSCHAARP